MFTSGLIIAAVALILVLGGTLLLPICTPCIALFLGAVSGFLTPHFEKTPEKPRAVTRGAYSGAIAGIGAFLGQAIGATINAVLVGPSGAADIARSFGFQAFSGFDSGYWIGMVASTVCISVFNVLLMAGMGALGGLLWWQFIGRENASSPVV